MGRKHRRSYCEPEVYAVIRMLSGLQHRLHMWGILLLPKFLLVHLKIEEKQLDSRNSEPNVDLYHEWQQQCSYVVIQRFW